MKPSIVSSSPPGARSAPGRRAPGRPWRRFVHLQRRTLAALATGLAVLAILTAVAPSPPEQVAVVALARDTPGGTPLVAGDLIVVSLPPEAVPAGALVDPAAAVGQVLNGPHAARAVVTAASVATGQALARPGYLVAPLPLSDDALAPLLRPGVRIDLFDASGGAIVASDVRIVAVPEQEASMFSGSSRPAILVEVDAEAAATLARVARAGGIAVALR